MRKNGKKNISYAIAAGVLLGSVSMTSLASPVAGVVGMASTDSATVASNSYSTLSGVSLTLANILSDASAAANNTSDVADNNTTTVEQQAPESEYANVAIAQVDNYVNIRSTPSEDGDVVGKLYNKSAATVLATEGDWYQITSGNCTGYVKCEFVVVGDEELAKSVSTRLATVTTQTLYVREQPTTESSVEGMVPEGDDLIVILCQCRDRRDVHYRCCHQYGQSYCHFFVCFHVLSLLFFFVTALFDESILTVTGCIFHLKILPESIKILPAQSSEPEKLPDKTVFPVKKQELTSF